MRNNYCKCKTITRCNKYRPSRHNSRQTATKRTDRLLSSELANKQGPTESHPTRTELIRIYPQCPDIQIYKTLTWFKDCPQLRITQMLNREWGVCPGKSLAQIQHQVYRVRLVDPLALTMQVQQLVCSDQGLKASYLPQSLISLEGSSAHAT